MEEYKKLIKRQEELGIELSQVIVSSKKDSATRKKGDYVKKKLEKIEKLWREVQENHAELEKVPELKGWKYFTVNYVGQIEGVYKEAVSHIKGFEEEEEEEEVQEEELAPLKTKKLIVPQLIVSQDEEQKKRESKLRYKILYMDELIGKLEKGNVNYKELRENLRKHRDDVLGMFEELIINEIDSDVVNQRLDLRRKFEEKVEGAIMQVDNAVENGNKRTNVSLPQIQIPVFGGGYDDWMVFHDLFTTLIDDDKQLKDSQKMQYLKSHVRGEPAKLIAHLATTDANYRSAWEVLTDRYQNERLIAYNLMNKIYEIPGSNRESMYQLKELHDVVDSCMQAIHNLGIDTWSWGLPIGCLIVKKWDPETNRLFEQSLEEPTKVPTLDSIMDFLKRRFQSLEVVSQNPSRNFQPQNNNGRRSQEYNDRRKTQCCSFCKQGHLIYYCPAFKDLATVARKNAIRERKLCYVCLTHPFTERCNSQLKCRVCNQAHNTLLHYEQIEQGQGHATTSRATARRTALSNISRMTDEVVLTTALVRTRTWMGTHEYLRVLLDSGSQGSFITERAAELIGKPRERIIAEVSGIGASTNAIAKTKMQTEIIPRFPSQFVMQVEFLVLPSVTQALPSTELDVVIPESWASKMLADPTFNQPGPIDAILGAEELRQIFREGVEHLEEGLLGQNTTLGWVLSGSAKSVDRPEAKVVSMVSRTEEDDRLSKFWELEEVPVDRKLTQEEEDCEKKFENTIKREENGTYTVGIPFKGDSVELGESRPRAVARLLQLEKRLDNSEDLKLRYHQFLQEYLNLGHMRKVKKTEVKDGKYYIPHQPVIREESITTKLRVVFDASSKTTNGKSLNDMMHIGPRLQQELVDVLLRWRKHAVVINADVEKMYRQISIAEKDQHYQRILWRFNKNAPIEEYNLTTVTYGTTSAPYLAVKTLQKLALDESCYNPEISQVIIDDFYVDDLLTGADSVKEAVDKRDAIIQMMKRGGFTLRKWSSNEVEVINSLPEELKDQTVAEITVDNLRKALGVVWSPYNDTFRFKVRIEPEVKCTKRAILSEIAKLFDPLGWVAPVVVKAKMIIQELWIRELSWDEDVPDKIKKEWVTFYNQLSDLTKISLPRWIQHKQGYEIELHGFSDASEKAYGAVVYVRTIDGQGCLVTTLLTAKSKVAPIRTKSTLPRLELCAAVLLAKLLRRVQKALQIPDITLFAWTDSMITLAWIQGDPNRWKTFVANRVAEIHRYLPAQHWDHVVSEENPADLVSRGVLPAEIGETELWWQGPLWLKNKHRVVGVVKKAQTQLELKTQVVASYAIISKQSKDVSIVSRFSSLTRLLRVLSYCTRFIHRLRKQTTEQGPITVVEMDAALKNIVRFAQQHEYDAEYEALKKEGRISTKSKIFSLTPYLDKDGIMRIRGRLHNVDIPYDAKHPMILSPKSHLTVLIIREAHEKLLHGGNQLTLARIRQNFWIVNGKKVVRSVLSKCVRCIRYRATPMQQIMGDLPAPRVCPSAPLSHTGVDYAGPIQLRATKGRGHKSYKGYIVVFVCFATRAIHLEAVSDMTTKTFLAAFKRFLARRGTCTNMYSDNGTTFVGASNVLVEEVNEIITDKHLQQQLVEVGVTWHFIPPAAPHFGGLWEAGVKSTKYHLKRVIGDSTLTYEEMATLLCQIEACLNSRPLCAITNDVDDNQVLTPGHFLVGQSLISPACILANEQNYDFGSRWHLVQKMKTDFWKVWTNEYLSRLQQRPKWRANQENLQKGTMVLLKEHDVNPGKWPLARVIEVHPDSYGNVSMATLKRASGNPVKRNIHQLVLLPFSPEDGILDVTKQGD